jgi:hypothetical protein
MSETAASIIEAISGIRLGSVPHEDDIHSLISDALNRNGISFIHEARLGPGRRADFLVNRVAVEVKKGRPAPAALIRQLTGYLKHPEVDEIMVVCQRKVRLPEKIGGKPVYQISLDRLWGISLK